MLSEKEKKFRQHEKELNSLRNKMGSNLVWFDSLSKRRQYDLLFLWKYEKVSNRLTKPVVKYVKKYTWSFGKRKSQIVKVIEYPANLKHFIKRVKKINKFKTNISYIRNAAIDILLNKK